MIEPVARAPFAPPAHGLTGRHFDAAPSPPLRIRQVHGTRVLHSADCAYGTEADAVWTDEARCVIGIRTADCVPILLANERGGFIAAVHAGWRGLAAGIVPAALAALPDGPGRTRAWIGPCIRQPHYEVGEDVRDALGRHAAAFRPTRPGHWHLDLAAIAAAQLTESGISDVADCGLCTAADPTLPSHRRDASTDRLWTLAWLDD